MIGFSTLAPGDKTKVPEKYSTVAEKMQETKWRRNEIRLGPEDPAANSLFLSYNQGQNNNETINFLYQSPGAAPVSQRNLFHKKETPPGHPSLRAPYLFASFSLYAGFFSLSALLLSTAGRVSVKTVFLPASLSTLISPL